jgi:hypothetical protein
MDNNQETNAQILETLRDNYIKYDNSDKEQVDLRSLLAILAVCLPVIIYMVFDFFNFINNLVINPDTIKFLENNPYKNQFIKAVIVAFTSFISSEVFAQIHKDSTATQLAFDSMGNILEKVSNKILLDLKYNETTGQPLSKLGNEQPISIFGALQDSQWIYIISSYPKLKQGTRRENIIEKEEGLESQIKEYLIKLNFPNNIRINISFFHHKRTEMETSPCRIEARISFVTDNRTDKNYTSNNDQTQQPIILTFLQAKFMSAITTGLFILEPTNEISNFKPDALI